MLLKNWSTNVTHFFLEATQFFWSDFCLLKLEIYNDTFVYKFVRQARLFCICCIIEDVKIYKPLIWLLFSGSINRSIALQYKSPLGSEKKYKILAAYS